MLQEAVNKVVGGNTSVSYLLYSNIVCPVLSVEHWTHCSALKVVQVALGRNINSFLAPLRQSLALLLMSLCVCVFPHACVCV
jgi:hypothetical protein